MVMVNWGSVRFWGDACRCCCRTNNTDWVIDEQCQSSAMFDLLNNCCL